MKHDLTYRKYEQYEVLYRNKENFDESWKLFDSYSFSHVFKFDNNYGASVVKHYGSYGYYEDLFELAVLYFTDHENWHITYDTEITNDVIGYLNNEEVLELLEKIKNL